MLGCGRGTMSEAIGMLLRLDDDCVYGIDVIRHEGEEVLEMLMTDS